MKMFKRLLTMVLTVFMFAALTACSGGGTKEPDPAIGYWELSALIDTDGKENTEDVDLLKELGLVVSLTINEDGTSVLDMFGETTELTYADGKLTAGDEVIVVTVDGDTLKMEEEGQALVFARAEKPAE